MTRVRFLIWRLTFSQVFEVRVRFRCASGRGEDGEAFGEAFLGPGGELGLGVLVAFYEAPETLFGVGFVVGLEDGFE